MPSHAVDACRRLSAGLRETAAAANAIRPVGGPTAGAAARTLADDLRRNTPEMDDFLNELRRRGLLKG